MIEYNIQASLTKLFEKKENRIVIWYDAKKEFTSIYDELSIPGVEKIEVKNNEFGIKRKVFHDKPESKFLLYCPYGKPSDENNWLLDIEIAYKEFSTDKASQYLEDLSLPNEYLDAIKSHIEFFVSSKRSDALKDFLSDKEMSPKVLTHGMTAVTCSLKEYRITDILTLLIKEDSTETPTTYGMLEKFGLLDSLWKEIKILFLYDQTNPTIKDFTVLLLKTDFYATLDSDEARLGNDALNYVKLLKDSKKEEELYRKIADKGEKDLSISTVVDRYDYGKLLGIDTFKCVERKIIEAIAKEIEANTTSFSTISDIIYSRKESFWYGTYKSIYDALQYASEFFTSISQLDLSIKDASDAVNGYRNSWYRIDQLYRKFIEAAKREKTPYQGLDPIRTKLENKYLNSFLIPLNENWLPFMRSYLQVHCANTTRQNWFFSDKVRPAIQNGTKLVVIISDALRYEVGEELASKVRKKDRFTASVSPMLAMLPTYTKLGMAALLPNGKLFLNEDSTVDVDGTPSSDTPSRSKILQAGTAAISSQATAAAVQAKDIVYMQSDKLRSEYIKPYQILYVYHNIIDADDGEDTFKAAQEAIDDLEKVIMKLTSNNVNNIIVTADHGFIYREKAPKESDFISDGTVKGKKVTFSNRRFILGYGLEKNPGITIINPDDIGLDAPEGLEIAIPNSTLLFRQKGGQANFCHGGASLEELVVPIVEINKKRKTNMSSVEVQISCKTMTVTTGQVEITMYQSEPVSDKIQPVELTCSITSQTNEPLCTPKTLKFNSTDEDQRKRTRKETFLLNSNAGKFNGQDVYFKAEASIPGTSQKSEPITTLTLLLKRSYDIDFDF